MKKVNYINKPTRCTFLYVFVIQFFVYSTCFARFFRSLSGVHKLLYLQLCTNYANMPKLGTLAWYVQNCRYSNLWITDDE